MRPAAERLPGKARKRASARRVAIAALVAAVAGPAGAAAQAGTQGRPSPQDREQIERRIRAQMGRMMQQRLGLDEQEAARLSDVVQSFESRRRELFTQEQATRRRVEALLLERSTNQAEARTLLGRMVELRRQEVSLYEEEQAALLQVLTPTQVLQLQSLRQDLGQRIRALGPPQRRR
jgi:Spy/CpxP family protein refolding chaperone